MIGQQRLRQYHRLRLPRRRRGRAEGPRWPGRALARDAAAAAGHDSVCRPVAVFEALGRWYAKPGFRGCAVLNAAVEHHTSPAKLVAASHHLDRLAELPTAIAVWAGAADPAALGRVSKVG
jgi:hypothetical protein